jgi:hypothetical protein
MPLNFSLAALNVVATQSTLHTLDTYDDAPMGTLDAGVDIDCPVGLMRNLFKIKFWDDIISDEPGNDVNYYVIPASIEALNTNIIKDLATCEVNTTPMTTTLKDGTAMSLEQKAEYNLINMDFVRHLGYYIFGYHNASDLFVNEETLLTDINAQLATGVADGFTKALNACDTTNAPEGPDADGNYFTNYNESNENICREIFLRMMSSEPLRFSELSQTTDLQSLPFTIGDKILFKLTINVASGQTQYGDAGDVALRSSARTYNINLNLVDPSAFA